MQTDPPATARLQHGCSFNERKYRWVAHEKWTYSVTFDVPAAMTDAAHVDLVLNGVDTFASVFLNGAPIAELDSYHK